jgi:lipid A disaccharide synthetase
LSEYSPVNIIKAHTVHELMEPQVPEDRLVAELERIVDEGEVREQMIADLAQVRDSLFSADGVPVSAQTVSQRVVEMIITLATKESR